MIPCRAKMIDGRPVTFDWEERLLRAPMGDRYVSTFIGYGDLHVISEVPRYFSDNDRLTEYRFALGIHGVDTNTVEFLDGVPMFPRTAAEIISTKARDASWLESMSYPPPADLRKLNEGVLYMGERYLVGEAMIAAGAAALRDGLDRHGCIMSGTLWFREPAKVVTEIWRAMERARPK